MGRRPLTPCASSASSRSSAPTHAPKSAPPASPARATSGSPAGPERCWPSISVTKKRDLLPGQMNVSGNHARNSHPRTPPPWPLRTRNPAGQKRADAAASRGCPVAETPASRPAQCPCSRATGCAPSPPTASPWRKRLTWFNLNQADDFTKDRKDRKEKHCGPLHWFSGCGVGAVRRFLSHRLNTTAN
jgi:hypothetical protein